MLVFQEMWVENVSLLVDAVHNLVSLNDLISEIGTVHHYRNTRHLVDYSNNSSVV